MYSQESNYLEMFIICTYLLTRFSTVNNDQNKTADWVF